MKQGKERKKPEEKGIMKEVDETKKGKKRTEGDGASFAKYSG